jgi:hypothetical protein
MGRAQEVKVFMDLLLGDPSPPAVGNEDVVDNFERPDLWNNGIIDCHSFQNRLAIRSILAGIPGKHHETATDASSTNAAIKNGALHEVSRVK